MFIRGYEGYKPRKHFGRIQQTKGISMIKDHPSWESFVVARLSFAWGYFLINGPFNSHLPIIFHSKEIITGVQAFTYGYYATYWVTKIECNNTEIRIISAPKCNMSLFYKFSIKPFLQKIYGFFCYSVIICF